MPSDPARSAIRLFHRLGPGFLILASFAAAAAGARPAHGQSLALAAVRSRQVELHYRVMDADQDAHVQLWYTRDRGTHWVAYQASDPAANPLLFSAPAEGIYGLLLTLSADDGHIKPPAPGTPPQRWVLIDYTPPLAQWDGIEPGDDANARRLHLRWTAHDDHLLARPIAIAVQSSVDGTWQAIDSELPNTGRLDWTVPPGMGGQLSFKLTVSDQAGHSVERIHGPIPTPRWAQATTPATRPALTASTRPAGNPPDTQPAVVDMERRLKAQSLLRQGEWSVERGQYAVAIERFREALEADPDLLPAMSNLANIYYHQQDYARAIELYGSVLTKDPRSVPAMRGTALAYVAMKQYPESRDMLQRLLNISEKDAQARLDLGDVLFMMGDTRQAREHWTQAGGVDATAESVIRKARRRLELYGNAAAETDAAGNR